VKYEFGMQFETNWRFWCQNNTSRAFPAQWSGKVPMNELGWVVGTDE